MVEDQAAFLLSTDGKRVPSSNRGSTTLTLDSFVCIAALDTTSPGSWKVTGSVLVVEPALISFPMVWTMSEVGGWSCRAESNECSSYQF